MAQDPAHARRERPAGGGRRVACVVSRFHRELTGAMLDSARRELAAAGVADEDVLVAWVPGSFELPLVARRFARRRDVDAVVCLGLVLQGETTHAEHVARGAIDGLQRVMLESDKPVLLGVLTCATLEQARARALSGGEHDKGAEVARACLELLAALDEVEQLGARARGENGLGVRLPGAAGAGESAP